MDGQCRLVEIGLGRGFEVEVAMRVAAAHQHGGVAHLELFHVGRDVAHGEADAPILRGVRPGAVDQQHMMQ